jgi:excisionase family DNA binding protein
MLEAYPDILTVKELREILYIGRNLAYALLESGTIRGFRVGRDWRIRKDEVRRFVEEG